MYKLNCCILCAFGFIYNTHQICGLEFHLLNLWIKIVEMKIELTWRNQVILLSFIQFSCTWTCGKTHRICKWSICTDTMNLMKNHLISIISNNVILSIIQNNLIDLAKTEVDVEICYRLNNRCEWFEYGERVFFVLEYESNMMRSEFSRLLLRMWMYLCKLISNERNRWGFVSCNKERKKAERYL